MTVQNEMAAKIIGEIVANGMSMSDFDIGKSVNSAAIHALEEIRLALFKNCGTDEIKRILSRYGID